MNHQIRHIQQASQYLLELVKMDTIPKIRCLQQQKILYNFYDFTSYVQSLQLETYYEMSMSFIVLLFVTGRHCYPDRLHMEEYASPDLGI